MIDPVRTRLLGLLAAVGSVAAAGTLMLTPLGKRAAMPGPLSTSHAQLNLGFVYEQQKHWQEAVHYTKKALQLNPASTQAQAQLERVQALLQKKPPR